MAILKRGDSGLEVKRIQHILLSQGLFTGTPNGTFGPKTEQAVIYFQQTHQGKDGKMLDVDGEVGSKTLWALENPSGKEQTSGIKVQSKPSIARGLTPIRKAVVDLCVSEHKAGVCEVPDGANSGDGVDKYIKGFGPAFWCMLFVTWIRANSGLPLLNKKQMAHCQTVWNMAKTAGKAQLKDDYTPTPGDTFIMLYKKNGRFTGSGHTGIVTAVSENGKSFNAIEGNAGNRVKQTLRQMSQGDLIGFINDFPADEQPTDFPRGIVQGTAESATR